MDDDVRGDVKEVEAKTARDLRRNVLARLIALGYEFEGLVLKPQADGSCEAIVLGSKPGGRDGRKLWATWATHQREDVGDDPQFGGVYWGHYDLDEKEGRAQLTTR